MSDGIGTHLADVTDLVDGRPLADGAEPIVAGLLLARAIAAGDAGRPVPRLTWLTRGAIATEAAGAEVDPHGAAIWGALPTLTAELPAARPRVIDLPPAPDPARLAAALLADDPGEDRVALRGGRRLAPRLEPVPRRALRADPMPVDGTWLLTGGLGGIGLALAEHLAERGAPALVLVGRRPPDEAAAARIERCRTSGTTVRVASLDVTDRAALDALLAEVRATLPPLVGVVHAAGVLGDAPLRALTADGVRRVLAPKVAGGWALHHATAGDPVRVFALMGSIAARIGNPGQAAYGAANGFLDGLAEHRRAQGKPAICLAFGPWRAAGMAADAGDALARLGVDAFAPAEGVALVSRLAGLDRAGLAVARIDWPRWAASHPAGAPPLVGRLLPTTPAPAPAAPTAAPATVDRATLATMPAPRRREAIRAFVIERVVSLLELDAPPADAVPLVDLGFDSFFAVRLRGALDRADLSLPIARLLGEASVERLVALIEATFADGTDGTTDGIDGTPDDTEEFVF